MDDSPRKKVDIPIVLKDGELCGTDDLPNRFFGLDASYAQDIADDCKKIKDADLMKSVFTIAQCWVHEQLDMMNIMEGIAWSNIQCNWTGDGVSNRTFGYRMMAMGTYLILHGYKDEEDEMELLADFFGRMKNIPKEKMGKHIFFLSRAMEKGLAVQNHGTPEEAEALQQAVTDEHEDSEEDDDSDSDATQPMSPVRHAQPDANQEDDASMDF
jgi:hypothetical protein